MTELATKNSITLKGSAQMVQQFFHYGIHSILYQRGIYPSDNFTREKKYGMTLLVNKDPKLEKFLQPLLEHVEMMLTKRKLKKLVLVITDIVTKEALERWQFDIETPLDGNENVDENCSTSKDEKRIKQEISDVLRQITASVAFLPLLEQRCSFDVLVYTFRDAELPEGWADSSECHIDNAEQVQLRSFSTAIHAVHTRVQYKADL
uniref:Mitotic spindle assembly checkpoint protein MAD2A n=1 Tax=Globodera pallida TaxID=36090 RepID=A0A183CN73_GLOPA